MYTIWKYYVEWTLDTPISAAHMAAEFWYTAVNKVKLKLPSCPTTRYKDTPESKIPSHKRLASSQLTLKLISPLRKESAVPSG
jgi:hypothetical protein